MQVPEYPQPVNADSTVPPDTEMKGFAGQGVDPLDEPPGLEKKVSNLGTRRTGSFKNADGSPAVESIVVGGYTRFVTTYPLLFMLGIVVFIIVYVGALQIPANFSQGGAGGNARNSLKSKQADALDILSRAYLRIDDQETTIPKSIPPFSEQNWLHTISFWFQSKDKMVLSEANIRTQMNILERTVGVIGTPVPSSKFQSLATENPDEWTTEIRDNGFPSGFCLKIPTMTGNSTMTEGTTCAPPDAIYYTAQDLALANGITDFAFTDQKMLELLTLARTDPLGQFLLDKYVSKDLTANLEAGNLGAEWATGKARVGGPLPGYLNQSDNDDDQSVIYQRQYMSTGGFPTPLRDGWISDIDDIVSEELGNNKDIKVYYYGLWIWLARLLGQLIVEVSLAFVAVVFVWLFMWLQLGSVFLAITGMFEILISVVISMSTWKLFGNEGITFYQALVVYIILGIGADDIFVFLDAWKQARTAGKAVNESLQTRFQWTFTRASNAMLVTSTTTIVAFLLSSITDIPDISTFAQFAALVVIWDLVLVLTWFPASVVVHDRYFVSRADGSCASKCCGCCVTCCAEQWGLTEKSIQGKSEGAGELRWIERFFNDTLWNFLKGPVTKWVVVAIFFCLFLAGVICASTTVALTKKSIIDTIMVDGAELQEVLGLVTGNAGHFAQGNIDVKSTGYFVFGVDTGNPVSRGGTDPYHGGDEPEDIAKQLGKINWDTSKSLDTMVAQTEVKAACEKMRTIPSVVTNGLTQQKEVYCFMEDFERYRVAKGLSFPVPDGTLKQALADWKDDTSFASETAYENTNFTGVAQKNFDDQNLYKAKTNWVIVDGELRAYWVAGNNSLGTFVQDLDQIKPEYDEWDKVADEINDGDGLKAMVVTDRTAWIAIMDALVRGITTGVPLSFVLAYVVLILATTNWIVASIAIVSIMGVLSSFFITFALAGWELDFYSTIFFQLTVGLAVDYIVHVAHAFNESGAESREDKMRDSLTEMGVSVLSGAISTLGASVFLFSATFLLFFQYGAFIFFVIMWSIIWALFFFPTIMMMIGPQGQQGDIVPLRQAMARICGKGT